MNPVRAFKEAMSAAVRTEPRSNPPTAMAPCEPSISPMPTILLSQKPSNTPFLSAMNRHINRAMQPRIAVRLPRHIRKTMHVTKYAQPMSPRMPYHSVASEKGARVIMR